MHGIFVIQNNFNKFFIIGTDNEKPALHDAKF